HTRSKRDWSSDVCSSDLAHGNADHATVLRKEFAGWHGKVGQVLENLDPHGIDRRKLYDLPAFGPYTRGRHVLIGDAAHAMAPNQIGRASCRQRAKESGVA